jgi:hypothetical protein
VFKHLTPVPAPRYSSQPIWIWDWKKKYETLTAPCIIEKEKLKNSDQQ